ncbi:MAG: 4-alpha-glucanotransferase, partial [Candidatus Caenarcaniphilales bacterium]|nr:4-alpha-glucanotransferase [Candidatus Caenarcaniphilales bacterium]
MDEKSQLIRELAEIYGIEDSYVDFHGKTVKTSEKTYIGVLEALGVSCKSHKDLEKTLKEKLLDEWKNVFKPVYVIKSSVLIFAINVNLPQDYNSSLSWKIETENGKSLSGTIDFLALKAIEQKKIDNEVFIRYELKLPSLPDHGYHKLGIKAGTLGEFFASLIVVPDECFNPLINKEDSSTLKIWGPGIQLYTVRSERNWGIGDYKDLKTLVEGLHNEGAGIVGLNPLHSLDPSSPEDASPYFPSSRNFYNYLYIDIEAVAEFQHSPEARKLVLSEEFQNKLSEVRELELVNYTAVAELKLKVLNILFSYFKQQHIEKNTYHYQEFEEFVKAQGDSLHYFALFKALNEYLKKQNKNVYGWQQWPEEYQDPKSKVVETFSNLNKERIDFYKYLQWIGTKQINELSKKSRELCPPIGLYGDLAVGINPNGADAWMNKEVYSLHLSIGAPPDPANLKGQNWGLAAFNPFALSKQAYLPFIQILRKNMQLGGALRIDHFMSLYRLYCFPNKPDDRSLKGAYLKFPLDDLLGILALESHRNKCLIIGEDLGTVPPIISERMGTMGIMSYKLMCFEKDSFGNFKSPGQYKQNALVSFSTHDLPTLSGFWNGKGINVREELGLIPSKLAHKKMLKEGNLDKELLLKALNKENLLPDGISTGLASSSEISSELIQAVHSFLASSASLLLIVQLEDILQQSSQVNLPGTNHDVYPNWRRKLTVNLENLFQDPRIQKTFATIQDIRGFQSKTEKKLKQFSQQKCVIPSSTYRLQFNSHFKFKDAKKLIPYFKDLGISHIYASPLLKAHSQSHHGYDVISHTMLNPELGTNEEFDSLCDELLKNEMGLILDIVPNHMANTHENQWWMDVLEHGLSSSFAKYFDIDWFPIKPQLTGKVLLPILGSSYGNILQNSELKIDFKVEEGTFVLRYFDKAFPVDPSTYPQILNHRVEVLGARLGDNNPNFLEYQSIISSLNKLPSSTETDNNRRLERNRESKILKLRLTNLCHNAHAVAEFIFENTEIFNLPNDSTSLKLLHNLLERQVYRLAYWKVATEEINYRRFFDINSLIGVRMESLIVFWETHQFIFSLISEGKIQGLRVDHPDGLYDPAGYFKQVQEEIAKLKGIAKISDT